MATASTVRSTALDFMVSVDPYLNETSRHADVVLPPPPPSQSAHFDFALQRLAVRNQARYTPPALSLGAAGLTRPRSCPARRCAVTGIGYDADPRAGRRQVIATALDKATADPHSPVAGRPVDELAALLTGGTGP